MNTTKNANQRDLKLNCSMFEEDEINLRRRRDKRLHIKITDRSVVLNPHKAIELRDWLDSYINSHFSIG